ncbi:MAG: hypothetical protein IT350_02645 [Deltaproteobacteria bacterium]|nr:hypothetical protein [Deltaproteobacteria bacterium]
MTEETFHAMWEAVRGRIAEMLAGEFPDTDLDEITKLLERVQKGIAAARDRGEDVIVVNIAIPGTEE